MERTSKRFCPLKRDKYTNQIRICPQGIFLLFLLLKILYNSFSIEYILMFMFGQKTKKDTRKVLLIVEDDALLSRALSDAFAHEHFEIVTVANGSDVQEVAEKQSPSVILLDLILPGLDGFAVLKQLKSETKTASIPVVVVSNLSSTADVKSVKSLGAEEYFIKANTEISEIIAFVNKLV